MVRVQVVTEMLLELSLKCYLSTLSATLFDAIKFCFIGITGKKLFTVAMVGQMTNDVIENQMQTLSCLELP